MNRRQFIKGVAGLTALMVVPRPLLAFAKDNVVKEPKGHADLLEEMDKVGVIEGRTFFIERPVTIETHENCKFINCVFVFKDSLLGKDQPIITFSNKGYYHIEGSYFVSFSKFKGAGSRVKEPIYVNTQK